MRSLCCLLLTHYPFPAFKPLGLICSAPFTMLFLHREANQHLLFYFSIASQQQPELHLLHDTFFLISLLQIQTSQQAKRPPPPLISFHQSSTSSSLSLCSLFLLLLCKNEQSPPWPPTEAHSRAPSSDHLRSSRALEQVPLGPLKVSNPTPFTERRRHGRRAIAAADSTPPAAFRRAKTIP